jgi:hypothetical protein
MFHAELFPSCIKLEFQPPTRIILWGNRVSTRSLPTLVLALTMSAYVSAHSEQPTKVETAGDGAVVLRLLPNTDSGPDQFIKNWGNVTIARIPAAGEAVASFDLTPTLQGTSRTVIYGARLPPGTYRFEKISAHTCAPVCVVERITPSAGFSKFRIESGRLTDLGVLLESNLRNERHKVLVVHDSAAEHPETPDLVRELLPDLTDMAQRPRLSWIVESVPQDMAQQRQYALQHSVGLATPRPVDNDSFLFGTAEGIVVEASPSQPQVAYDVGERSSIEAVLVTKSGDWVAGGELGLLRLSRDRGQSWHSIRGNLPFGIIVSLLEWHDQIIATTLRNHDVYIHAIANGSEQWTELAHYEIPVVNGFWEIASARAESFLLKDGVFTAMPGRRLAYLDLLTGKSDVHPAPGAVHMCAVSGDEVIHCRVTPGLIKTEDFESTDLGKTWTDLGKARFAVLPAFSDKTHGVALDFNAFSHNKFMYTDDGGVTWIDGAAAPADARLMFYSKDGSIAFVGSVYGEFWASHDNGKTWQTFLH